MVNLIHRKRVSLLHNTVLILCDEGDGLVAVIRVFKYTKDKRKPNLLVYIY